MYFTIQNIVSVAKLENWFTIFTFYLAFLQRKKFLWKTDMNIHFKIVME